MELIQEVGNTVHSYVQDVYKFDEVEKSIEIEKYRVRGRVDAILRDSVVELKTIKKDKFTGTYLTSHYEQALIYAYILNTCYDYKINVLTIVYILRDLDKIIPFDINLNWNIEKPKAEMLLNRSNLLLDSLKNNILPDVIGSTKEECKYCPFRNICGKNENKINISQNENKNIIVLL